MFVLFDDSSCPHPLVIRKDQICAVYFDEHDDCVCVELLNGSIFQTSLSVQSIFSLLSSRF